MSEIDRERLTALVKNWEKTVRDYKKKKKYDPWSEGLMDGVEGCALALKRILENG